MAASIQRIGPGFEARLRALRLRALRDAPDAFGSTWEEVAEWPTERWTLQLRGLPTWLASEHDADVGVICTEPDDTDPSRRWLLSLWVAPEARGTGTGRALVETLARWATQQGASHLLLEVGAHNTAARRLYERAGFVYSGQSRVVAPPRDHITELLYERILRPTDG